MKANFKVGDTVKIVKNLDEKFYDKYIGTITKIKVVIVILFINRYKLPIKSSDTSPYSYWKEEELELVVSKIKDWRKELK